jgi:hypothetical protein
MEKIATQPGDIFLTTHEGSGLSKAIISAEKYVLSEDKDARYSHAAHFDEKEGLLLDTLWKVQHTPISEYSGHRCAIYRPVCDPQNLNFALAESRKDLGQRYPWQRLILHLLKLADNIHWNRLVCSECEAKFLHLIFRMEGCFDFEHYYGVTPDWLDDYCRSSDRFETILDGEL